MLLVERMKERRQQEDRRAGEVVAMLYNLKFKETIDWTDVFTEWAEEESGQTEDEMFRAMLQWTTVKPPPS